MADSTRHLPEQRLPFYVINYYFVSSHLAVFKISISYVKKIGFYLLEHVEVMKY